MATNEREGAVRGASGGWRDEREQCGCAGRERWYGESFRVANRPESLILGRVVSRKYHISILDVSAYFVDTY